MGITYGDHLIDSGYYDITPEQERSMTDEQEILKLASDLAAMQSRAEAAERVLKQIAESGEYTTGDGHAHCVAIARAALSAHKEDGA
jgi:hypothetical protein